jgi:hypothetical protein
VIAAPFDDASWNASVTLPFPAVADVIVGAPGALAGVTELEGDDVGPGPVPLVALTLKVYAVPSVDGVHVVEVDAVAVHDPAPEGVTVYPVIAEPPVVGFVQLTVTLPVDFAVAMTPVGALGAAFGVAEDADE